MPHPEPTLPLSLTSQTAPTGTAAEEVTECRAFGIQDCEPDWSDGRYRVYAARDEADCMRYGQGRRYNFCISRRHHNYYHDYRARYNSSYYFVYDDACSPHDKTHVTVVAARSDGTHDVIYATNSADYDTRRISGSLERFLATKPGLAKAKELFTCQPLTPAEITDIKAARAAATGAVAFEALTPAQQLMLVYLGIPLTDAEYAQAPNEVREAYISRAHLLTDQQARCSTEAQRRRSAQLFKLYNETERLHPAEWLSAYPAPEPAIVAAHHITLWPPSAAALATWHSSTAPGLASLPVREGGEDLGGPCIAGPDGKLCLTKLQKVVATGAPTLFPVQELEENPDGAVAGPVIIARLRDGYVVLTGNAELGRAQMAGDVDIPVRLSTRAHLAHARVGAA